MHTLGRRKGHTQSLIENKKLLKVDLFIKL